MCDTSWRQWLCPFVTFMVSMIAVHTILNFSAAAEGTIGERGVYLNIPAPLDPITVHDWSDGQWSW